MLFHACIIMKHYMLRNLNLKTVLDNFTLNKLSAVIFSVNHDSHLCSNNWIKKKKTFVQEPMSHQNVEKENLEL